MCEFIKSKKQLAVTIIFSLIILFGIVVSFTFVDKIVLHYVEIFFHKTLRNPARWIDIIQNTSRICIFVLCLIYYLCYIKQGIVLKSKITERISELKNQYLCKRTVILFSALCLFFFIAYYSIITANYFYADDVFRNYGGNRSWIGFSRYISEFGSIFLHNSLNLNDIAPLTQFIAIVVASVTVMILSVALTETVKIKNLLGLTLIFIAPFYAENISYRFDCPYMALSLLFSAVPFLFRKEKISFMFVSFLGLLLTSFSYQAALTLYILCTIYIFAKNYIKGENLKENLSFVLRAVLSFVIAMIVFKLFFMNKMTNDADDYFSTKLSLSAFIPNTIQYIKMTFTLNGGLLSKALFVLSIIILAFAVLKSSKKKILNLLFIFAIIAVAYALSFGPYLVFERPVFASRAFMGFNTLIALLLLANIEITDSTESATKFSICLSSLTVYSCIVFMFAYGNCLKNQKDYEDFRTQLIISDISNYMEKGETYNINYTGKIDHCKKSRIAIRNYPLIKMILPNTLTQGSSWTDEILNGYNLKITHESEQLTEDFELLKENYYHKIYKYNNSFIVVLK